MYQFIKTKDIDIMVFGEPLSYPRFYHQGMADNYDERLTKAYRLLFLSDPDFAKTILAMNDHKGTLLIHTHKQKKLALGYISLIGKIWEICGELAENVKVIEVPFDPNTYE